MSSLTARAPFLCVRCKPVSTTSLVRAEHECMYTLRVADNEHKAMEIMLNPYAGIIVATYF